MSEVSDMSMESCGCDRFDRLEGAATQAYIVRFLERIGADEARHVTYYRCHVCGRDWSKIEDPEQRRPSLVRLPDEEKV